MPSLYAVIEEERREAERYREEISKRNIELQEKAINFIQEAIAKMLCGEKDYAEMLLYQAQDLINNLKL